MFLLKLTWPRNQVWLLSYALTAVADVNKLQRYVTVEDSRGLFHQVREKESIVSHALPRFDYSYHVSYTAPIDDELRRRSPYRCALWCWYKTTVRIIITFHTVSTMSRRQVRRLVLLLSMLVALITTSCHSADTDNDVNADGRQEDYYDNNLSSGIVLHNHPSLEHEINEPVVVASQYSVNQKSSALKLFAIFSLALKLCDWKLPRLLPNTFLPLHQFWFIYLNICMNCITFTTSK